MSGGTATADGAAAGAGGGSVHGPGIRRAVVLGYVVDVGGGAAAAPETQYLVEVETSPRGGVAEGAGSWVCYKR